MGRARPLPGVFAREAPGNCRPLTTPLILRQTAPDDGPQCPGRGRGRPPAMGTYQDSLPWCGDRSENIKT